jgi:hypothetical protein
MPIGEMIYPNIRERIVADGSGGPDGIWTCDPQMRKRSRSVPREDALIRTHMQKPMNTGLLTTRTL